MGVYLADRPAKQVNDSDPFSVVSKKTRTGVALTLSQMVIENGFRKLHHCFESVPNELFGYFF